MEENKLSPHQKVLLSMLNDFDTVCTARNIPYILFSGSALGAVRHGGFIPWDDDVDVMLLRPDYERLFDEAAGDFDPELYYLQREFSDHWPMQFSKLRLNATTCMEKYHPKDPEQHQGVYLDIFPCDNLSDHRVIRSLQYLFARAVVAKALYARGYETNSVLKKVFMQVCRLLPRRPMYRFVLDQQEADSSMVHSFFGCGTKYRKNVFPRQWITDRIWLPFEDSSFPVSANCDELLTKLYGDYRRLPDPAERRIKEHTAILDLERPYQDYLEAQRKMRFETLTRSIR